MNFRLVFSLIVAQYKSCFNIENIRGHFYQDVVYEDRLLVPKGIIQKIHRNAFSILDPGYRYRTAYRDLLSSALHLPDVTENHSVNGLSTKRSKRILIPENNKEIGVVAFGTNDDWRRHGIWASLDRMTRFHLFAIPDEMYPGCSNGQMERSAKQSDFLAVVNGLNRTGTVHMAVFSHSGRHISDALIDSLHDMGIWTIVISADDQHQFISPNDETGRPHQLRVAAKADLYWSSWSLGVRIINSFGGNGWFAPHGADPNIYYPISCEKEIEVVFVGGCSGMRAEFVRSLGRFFKVTSFGHGWPNGSLPFEEMIKVFSRAKIVLGVGGIGHTLAVQMLKGRDFEVPMCGATYATSFYSVLAKYFNLGTEICCWSSLEDCVELVADLLQNSEKCLEIGKSARNRSLREHTWDHRIQRLLGLFRSQPTESEDIHVLR